MLSIFVINTMTKSSLVGKGFGLVSSWPCGQSNHRVDYPKGYAKQLSTMGIKIDSNPTYACATVFGFFGLGCFILVVVVIFFLFDFFSAY